MALNCLVIGEDLRKHLQPLLAADGRVGYVFNAIHPYEVRAALNNHVIDVVFIRVTDWDYPLVKGLHEMETVPPVVYVSLEKDNYIKELGAQIDFHLREPIDKIELARVLDQTSRNDRSVEINFLFIKHRWRNHRIGFSEIEMIERTRGNKLMFYTAEHAFELWGTLSKMLPRLPGDRFQLVGENVLLPVTVVPLIKDGHYMFRGRKIVLKPFKKSRKKIQATQSQSEEVIA